MADKVSLILTKVERAKKHISDLQVACKAFFDTNPYVIGTYSDLKTRDSVYYLVSDATIPTEISVIAGDTLQNLRSSLDHLAYQLFLIHNARNVSTHRVYFPIAKSLDKYNEQRAVIMKGMGQRALDGLDALKPYKGGNETLWRLNQLNNTDKHRLLITVGLTNLAHSMTLTQRRKLERVFVGSHPATPVPELRNVLTTPEIIRCPLKVGDILLSAPESEVEPTPRFHFDIAFSEPQIIEGQSVYLTLHAMANSVENVVLSFRPLLG